VAACEDRQVLGTSEQPLSQAYDTAVLDLDGVVYVGADAVAGAPEHLAAARRAGMHLAYVTNNAARPPETVSDHLRSLGIETDVADVVTSAQAAARLLADRVPAGSKVYLIGGDGLAEALVERGLVPVTQLNGKPDAGPVAVAQGYGPDMPWRQVVAGAILVRDGLPWVASNTDLTIPTATGIGPGNGTLVRLIAEYAEREPVVAGKPQRPLFEETLRRVGGSRPLVVGDRLDTDIEGAHNVGWDSLLVLTGVTGLAELVAAGDGQRPTYLAPDLAALAVPQQAPEIVNGSVTLGGWRAEASGGRLVVEGDGSPGDWWRVVAVAAWTHLDRTGGPVDTSALNVPGTARR
jgi:HAD superfamily hydrolase (TIGR01450 family)